MKLKRLKENQPIPDDFWNYDINIILGYRHREVRNTEIEQKKYGIYPIRNDSEPS